MLTLIDLRLSNVVVTAEADKNFIAGGVIWIVLSVYGLFEDNISELGRKATESFSSDHR